MVKMKTVAELIQFFSKIHKKKLPGSFAGDILASNNISTKEPKQALVLLQQIQAYFWVFLFLDSKCFTKEENLKQKVKDL